MELTVLGLLAFADMAYFYMTTQGCDCGGLSASGLGMYSSVS